MEVYFLICTDSDGINLQLNEIAQGLLSYPNIHLRFINPLEFSKNTKLENFFESGILKKSSYSFAHYADVLRVLLLNRYGGPKCRTSSRPGHFKFEEILEFF